jgi:multiple antibiotic resistance protein
MSGEDIYAIHTELIFTLFIVMLGPFRLLDQFPELTLRLERKQKQILALKTGFIAMITLIIGGFIGSKLLEKWGVPPPVLLLAGGIIFFLVAIVPFLSTSSMPPENQVSLNPQDIALSVVITPYGMAAVIVLFSTSHSTTRLLTIIGCLVGVMLLNMIIMAFNKSEKDKKKSLLVKILTGVLAPLQFSLVLHVIIGSLKALGIIHVT